MVSKFLAMFFGILMLGFGAFEISLGMHNQQVVEHNEELGYHNPSDEDTVQFQYTCAIISFVIGAALLAISFTIHDKKTRSSVKRSTPQKKPIEEYSKLKTLNKMYKDHLITEEEYEEKRKEILSRL